MRSLHGICKEDSEMGDYSWYLRSSKVTGDGYM